MRTTLTNAISITGILLCLLLTTDRLVAADAQSELGVDDRSATLLDDRFDTLDPGQFSSIVGAHTEYHYLKDVAPKGHWSVTSFRSDIGSQRAWKVFRIEDDAVLAQTFDNKKTRHAHPMVIAGDDAWGDYTLTVRFAPQFDRAQSGVVFRYRNDRAPRCAGHSPGWLRPCDRHRCE